VTRLQARTDLVAVSCVWLGGSSLVVGLSLPVRADAAAPLSYLEAYGPRAYPINSLLWGLIAISFAVIVMAIVLVLMGTFRGRARGEALPGRLGVERPGRGIEWVVIGVGVSTLVLFAVTLWTVVTLAAVSSPPGGKADLNLEIVGHQWWWEVIYQDDQPAPTFHSANEMHIPVNRNVAATLKTTDVIHSFWVPTLTSKTDLIPGQTNQTWFAASRPGIYRGQCTEYCGKQHAHMGFEVIAQSPDDFSAWRAQQLRPAPAPVSDEAAADRNTFVQKCGACHSVVGTPAAGVLGPDLSHLMGRRTIAAATLPNTVGHLSAWIADPQHVKPGALMPRLDVSGPELERIRRFLATLE
jgi:cytochrome c oxidase subunit II